MEDYMILPNIYIMGQENAVNFVLELRELVEEYGGDLEFDVDSELDVIVMTEEDEPGGITLEEYFKGDGE
ncbi:MAG: hypothetical protein EOM07_12420 [Clostridia bacterium]|nr:hypothetical protein [Clostridia bacterium]